MSLPGSGPWCMIRAEWRGSSLYEVVGIRVASEHGARMHRLFDGPIDVGNHDSMNLMATPEHFKISAHLKDIIGRDLVTNEFVAVFELVKNAVDANASR